MDLQSLKELFIEQLEDALDAEKQLVKAIPDMVDAAKTPELRSAFEEHLTQTKGQVGRLEQVFSVIGEPAKEGSCDAMEGLIKEAKSMIKADGQAAVVDAASFDRAPADGTASFDSALFGLLTFASVCLSHVVAYLLGSRHNGYLRGWHDGRGTARVEELADRSRRRWV